MAYVPRIIAALGLFLLAVGCATRPTAPPPGPPAAESVPAVPTVTRGEFTLEADKLDTWNALGQIVVNTPGVEYLGRSQLLDLYTVRYRGEEFLILTKALLLTETIRRTTTRVTATTPDGRPIDSDAAADLLAQVQVKLPAAIEAVHVRQAAEAAAKKAQAKKKAKKKKAH
jgi:hypothetical protein